MNKWCLGGPSYCEYIAARWMSRSTRQTHEYQNLSKWALFLFSTAKKVITPSEMVMIHPVAPGPVRKFAPTKPTIPVLVSIARNAKLNMWAMM
jgi:hypothetical protein